MINILAVCPDPNDATSFYRGVGPMARLRKMYRKDISVRFVSEVNWSTLLDADLVFMQRPFHTNHRSCAEMIKGANIPLWTDYDDNLYEITPDNPVYGLYKDEAVVKSVARSAAISDVVTVSTESLAQVMKQFNQNVVVVPNTLDDLVCQRNRPQPVPEENFIFWRGTNTHSRDLNTVGEELIELSYDSRLANWKFVFVGFNPWWITEKMKASQTLISGGAAIIDYFQAIYDMQPRIMIVPLAKSKFNEAKSNIAWIEGTYAGAAVVAQDLPEFKMPGILTYSEPKEFSKSVTHLAEQFESNPDALIARNEESWSHIQRNLTLKHTTELRRAIVDKLLS